MLNTLENASDFSENDIAPGTCIEANEPDLQNAIINLVVNASHAMRSIPRGKPREIEISALSHSNAVILSVTDHGCGIPEGMIMQCMQPFSTTKGEEGTGIGLPSVEACMKAHSAFMDIDSHPGLGTTITLIIPISGKPDIFPVLAYSQAG